MSGIFRGSEMAAKVVGNTGGAAVKVVSKIDTTNFSWVDAYLRDEAIRNKIQSLRNDIQTALKSPVDREELKSLFESVLAGIHNERLSYFTEMLKAVQNRTGHMTNTFTMRGGAYIPPISLSRKDIDTIFGQLDKGIKQADIDARAARLREEITRLEGVIASELSPRERWIYRDDGKPEPYPQGCRWTQYVTAWKMVVSRFEGEVGVEGEPLKSDGEKTAYFALGLDRVAKITPLRRPIIAR